MKVFERQLKQRNGVLFLDTPTVDGSDHPPNHIGHLIQERLIEPALQRPIAWHHLWTCFDVLEIESFGTFNCTAQKDESKRSNRLHDLQRNESVLQSFFSLQV